MKLLYLIIIILFFSNNCTTYKYDLRNYKVPVSFSNEKKANSRSFRIEAKITYLLFDLINIEKFDMEQKLKTNLPRAKSIYNLQIRSEEGPLDSAIRLVSTGAQIWAFISNRPLLFSRRTIIITGDVEEEEVE